MPSQTSACIPTDEPIDRWGFPIRSRIVTYPAKTLPKLDPRFTEASPKRRALVARLQTMCRNRAEGQTFSNREIARFCGVSPEYIRKIGRSGLRKLRDRLPGEVREAFAQLLAIDRTSGRAKSSGPVPGGRTSS